MMSHRLKLRQAEAHLERLEQSVKRWKESNPYDFPGEFNRQTGEYIIRLEMLRPFPEEWGLIAGDVLFNLRASLDHLAFSLAVKHKNGILTDSEIRDCCFPILARPFNRDDIKRFSPLFDAVVFDNIKRINPGELVAAYNNTTGGTRDVSYYSLLQLHVLNNIDKHRSLHIVATRSAGGNIEGIDNLHVSDVQFAEGIIEDGGELARFTVSPQNAQRDAEIGISLDMLECISDALGGVTIPIDQGLRHFVDIVKNTFSVFEPSL